MNFNTKLIGIKVQDIDQLSLWEHIYGKSIKINQTQLLNLMRPDNHPSGCIFKLSDGKLVYKDFAKKDFPVYDSIHVYAYLNNLSYKEALYNVINNKIVSIQFNNNYVVDTNPLYITGKPATTINKASKEFLGLRDLSQEYILKYSSFVPEYYSIIKGAEVTTFNIYNDVVLFYKYNNTIAKVYRPFRNRENNKFVSNIRSRYFYYPNKNAKVNIIIKANKDALVISKHICANIYVVPTETFIPDIKFNGTFYSLYDNDEQGRTTSDLLYEKHGVIPLFVPKYKDYDELYINEKTLAIEFAKNMF